MGENANQQIILSEDEKDLLLRLLDEGLRKKETKISELEETIRSYTESAFQAECSMQEFRDKTSQGQSLIIEIASSYRLWETLRDKINEVSLWEDMTRNVPSVTETDGQAAATSAEKTVTRNQNERHRPNNRIVRPKPRKCALE